MARYDYDLDELRDVEGGLSTSDHDGLPYFLWTAEGAGAGKSLDGEPLIEPCHFYLSDFGKLYQIERSDLVEFGLFFHWPTFRRGWSSFRLGKKVFAEKFGAKLARPDASKDENGNPTWKACFRVEVVFWHASRGEWSMALWQQDTWSARCAVEGISELIKRHAADKLPQMPRLTFVKTDKLKGKQKAAVFPTFKVASWGALPEVAAIDPDQDAEDGVEDERDDDPDVEQAEAVLAQEARREQQQRELARKAKQAEAAKQAAAADAQAQERLKQVEAAHRRSAELAREQQKEAKAAGTAWEDFRSRGPLIQSERPASATASAAASEAETVEAIDEVETAEPVPIDEAPFEAAPPVEAAPAADAPKLSTAEVLKARYANRGKNGQNARA